MALGMLIVVLFFGPRKLPELGKSLGKAIGAFKKGLKDGDEEGRSKPDGSGPAPQ